MSRKIIYVFAVIRLVWYPEQCSTNIISHVIALSLACCMSKVAVQIIASNNFWEMACFRHMVPDLADL